MNWNFILLRLSEDSTWKAIGHLVLVVAGLIGWQISDAKVIEIGAVVSALSYLVAIFLPALGSPVTVNPDQISAAVKKAIDEHLSGTTPPTEQK